MLVGLMGTPSDRLIQLCFTEPKLNSKINSCAIITMHTVFVFAGTEVNLIKLFTSLSIRSFWTFSKFFSFLNQSKVIWSVRSDAS